MPGSGNSMCKATEAGNRKQCFLCIGAAGLGQKCQLFSVSTDKLDLSPHLTTGASTVGLAPLSLISFRHAPHSLEEAAAISRRRQRRLS